MLKLKINKDQGHDILKLTTRRWYRTKLKFLMTNIIGLDITTND
jgi:hypothetical protein